MVKTMNLAFDDVDFSKFKDSKEKFKKKKELVKKEVIDKYSHESFILDMVDVVDGDCK